MLQLNKIYNLDCVKGLKLLDDRCIDLTLTSPPYGDLRDYYGYQFDFKMTAKELYRVTKNGGIVVWVTSDKTKKYSESGTLFAQALYFKEIGFKLYDTMIYAKMNPIPLTHRRYEQGFEYMFVFSKGKPNTFNPLMVSCKDFGKGEPGNFRQDSTGELKPANKKQIIQEKKIKSNIWYYPVGKGSSTDNFASKHPAIFPEQLAEDHIKSWTNENDLVLDIFMGSGTTAKMSVVNKRNYNGFEISEHYCDLAIERRLCLKANHTIKD